MLISNWRLKAHDLTVEDRRTAADGDLERENRGGGGRGERGRIRKIGRWNIIRNWIREKFREGFDSLESK